MFDLVGWLIDKLIPPPFPDGYQYCPMCHGTGHGNGSTVAWWTPCGNCNGLGFVTI